LQEVIKKENLTKTMLAVKLETSHASINRFLDPNKKINYPINFAKEASILGKKFRFELL